ncbi:uncharacterized protein F13E9.13, mitochondrial [Eurytemora carolleeae]|uniref:uncharacterized protein F13E9.13, mitochondrial n=1 Tax=Eurytemora carolleeae TaxID=1294199 RepID=UPI000C76E945|nr:uncharacterized protein F13E9.13, mitochondrial [Eurytemora carolleeae]|eukprot:XP_023334660.1 uncharacterized protein F13E9.13, mitochondrial-like [Eurytemora affinis]
MRFKLFEKSCCNIIGMIHVPALPGTPSSFYNMSEIMEKIEYEANVYRNHGVNGIILENMHDTPYSRGQDLGPEITACMSVLGSKVRSILPRKVPVGIQILAGANQAALAAALSADLQFVRVEGFVFSHVADEGWIDSCAGELLRFRRKIGAGSISIFSDIKKKHCSHSVTSDVDIIDTAKAADFFRSDGVIITGTSTGSPASPLELELVSRAVPTLPVFIGSGVSASNLPEFSSATGLIIGTYFKKDGDWRNDLDEGRIEEVMSESRKYLS